VRGLIGKRLNALVLESTHLMQVVINDNSCGCGEIQTPNLPPHGNSIARITLPDERGETDRLSAKEQIVPRLDFRLRVIFRSMAAESDQPALFLALKERFEAAVMAQVYFRPVIEPRPLQMLVIDLEAERVNQMQAKLRSPAQPGDVACVRRYLRLMENHVKIRPRSNHEDAFRPSMKSLISCTIGPSSRHRLQLFNR